MPQKPVFSKAPILAVPHCFPSNGTVRSADERIRDLYSRSVEHADNPYLWEGLFRVACLIKNKPMDERVSTLILNAIRETDNGSFEGSLSTQISIVRAALAVYEYNTERTILQRIAVWCRFLEIDFDQLIKQDPIPLYKPADLMEFLVRFYQITGLKAVLRICTRLRAAAFNWTSALHTFQQSIPVQMNGQDNFTPDLSVMPADIDYDEKEKLINHAEMLADGVRYSVFSGLFSGNGQDLAAGRTVWRYLHKHHFALCGGTTSNPYLCGRASDQPVSNRAVAAWAEAFASQMILDGSEWALDELIRIVYNALEECINRKKADVAQKVNTAGNINPEVDESAELLARLTRAVAAVYTHVMTLTEKGIMINYLLPGKIMAMIRKQPVVFCIDSNSAVIQSRKPFSANLDVFVPATGTSALSVTAEQNETIVMEKTVRNDKGYYIHLKQEWQNQDGIRFDDTDMIICEKTHHQGICIIHNNHLYSLPVNSEGCFCAISGEPEISGGEITIPVSEIAVLYAGENMNDIPVLPSACGPEILKKLKPYSKTYSRITMFPKVNHHV